MAKQKRKQSVLGLFFSFFLKAVVIILGLVILDMGAYLIRAYFYMKGNETDAVVDENAFEDDQKDELLTSEAVSDDDLLFETASEEETSEVIYIPYETSIAVINATDTAGLAAAWKAKLEEAGYTNIQTGNYLNGTLDTSKLVTSDETLSALQGGPEGVEIEVASSDSVATDVPPEGVVVYLLVGWDNDIVSQQASE